LVVDHLANAFPKQNVRGVNLEDATYHREAKDVCPGKK